MRHLDFKSGFRVQALLKGLDPDQEDLRAERWSPQTSSRLWVHTIPIGTKDTIAERVTVGGLGTCTREADTDCDVDEGNDRRDYIGTFEIHALSWYMIEVGGGDTYLLCLPFSPQV
ncbi:hypothetical protein EDC04DRAFT_2598416 [Pisolithus marmoratus]|nr:hypothetical protein EDC04DRAFT_2598416 [Pisolithus marmoratus]